MSWHSERAAGLVIVVMFLELCITVPINGVAAEVNIAIPGPLVDNPKTAGPLQTAVIAGGCFWGVQGVFEHVRGVKKVLSGYSGGDKSTAQYEVVSTGRTGHAESVQIVFDPKEVSFPTASFCKSTSPWRMTQRNSIARDRTRGRSIDPTYSMLTNRRKRSHRHTSRSWIKRGYSAVQSPRV
jgi:hypothetical protein